MIRGFGCLRAGRENSLSEGGTMEWNSQGEVDSRTPLSAHVSLPPIQGRSNRELSDNLTCYKISSGDSSLHISLTAIIHLHVQCTCTLYMYPGKPASGFLWNMH